MIPGDLHDSDALQQLLAGCDAVVHCAGTVRGSSWSDFEHTNVDGTRLLLEALQAQLTRPRAVLLSSLAAREPQLSWYARSKRGGEELLEKSSGFNWAILRPPPVYGPGDEEMKAVFDWMARGIALVPGSPDARLSLIHVSDLVEGIISCLLQEAVGNRSYTLCDGKPGGYDWHELAATAATVWQRPVRLLRVPRALLNTVASLNLRLARLTGRAPMLTPAKLRELRHTDWVVDNDAFTARTGWRPQTGLAEGLRGLANSEL